jgi:murein DD-endopeptidase MepM/ murein hydrolase activator NlpD
MIGQSGNTGNTNNFPHLHLGVHACDPVVNGSGACVTQSITFRNTTPNPPACNAIDVTSRGRSSGLALYASLRIKGELCEFAGPDGVC